MKKIILLFMLPLFFTSMPRAQENPTGAAAKNPKQPSAPALPYGSDGIVENFTKTVHGGVQHVVAKSAGDAAQIKLIQNRLQKRVEQYRNGDFSETERAHGSNMPGLTQLKLANPNDIKFEYKPLDNGGQIHYSSEYSQYIEALHEWFDAQNSAHGAAELPNHKQHHQSTTE